MTREEMAKFMDYLHETENKVRASAQREYAHEDGNAFANFERIASRLKCINCGQRFTREQILMVYLLKHIDGIIAYVNGNETQREPIEGRIHDARIYEALLGGMFKENSSPVPIHHLERRLAVTRDEKLEEDHDDTR